jgi:hypothetical protein
MLVGCLLSIIWRIVWRWAVLIPANAYSEEGKSRAQCLCRAAPKGRKEGEAIEDYTVEDHKDHVLKTFKTQKEAIDWAKKEGHHPLVARVRHENNKTKPDHWRSAG